MSFFLRKIFLVLLAAGTALAASATEMPAYLREAFARFHSDAPPEWAFTLTTTRGNNTSVERFDPSRPKGGEWSLLRSNDREPTADELQRYQRYKVSNAPSTSRASFSKDDLDLATLALVREDAERAEFVCRFREDRRQPLLAHVDVTFTVVKASKVIERAVMRLTSPFSPALGVRMKELELTMTFAAESSPDGAVLPRTAHSRFRGQMFFLVPLNEELRIEYSDFTRVPAKK